MRAISVTALVVLLVALTVAGVVVGDGNLGLAILPTLAIGMLYAVWKLPLRYPVLVLTFLALTLENPSDVPAVGLWKSPLYPVGAILLAHMNLSFPQKWMFFSGLDLVLAYLFTIALVRWARGSRASPESRLEAASPMRLFAAVSLGGAAFMWVWGVARGGADVASSLWQMQRVVYLPLVFFLFQLSLRGHRDRTALVAIAASQPHRWLLIAACAMATIAKYLSG